MHFKGLTESEAKQSREVYGSNVIPDSEPTTFWAEFAETFQDPMIRILLGIAVIMTVICIMGKADVFEPIGIITAVFIVALVSAKTGVASDTKYRELKEATKKETCKVYRDDVVKEILFDDVVVGDKILIQAGDKIPADGILINGRIKVDNSALNGEAEECEKLAADEGCVFPEELSGDTFVDKHSLFRGSVLFDGEGVLEVKKVGTKTVMGKMAEDMQVEQPDSPLKVKLSKLASQISTFGYIGGALIAVLYFAVFVYRANGVGIYFDQPFSVILKDIIEAVSLAVVVIVCAVPEGLPLMISLVLMQNTGKMLDHNVLVRKDEGIETAGSLNILFSDKTGTITRGKLEVVELFTADGEVIPLDKFNEYEKINQQVNLAVGKNSQSMFDESGRVIGGNATDQALLKFIGKEAASKLALDEKLQVTDEQTFNSTNKFSQASIEGIGKVFYKGAPERLLAKAKSCLNSKGEKCTLDKESLNKKIDELASKSMRVLAFGYSESPLTVDKINEDIVITALAAIRDDVRPEAVEAIEKVRKAGIQVVMITGDRLETAKAIAKDAGLLTDENDIALTSSGLNAMSDEKIKEVMPKIRVIARAMPTDKSRMVRLCQEMNLVVGMTGDGVNDSPALKRADVGFAMGSGTEAAKEAGDIVILDDNFKSIKDAIWYGRTIYNNILKFCRFQLVINVSAVLVSIIAPFFHIDEPLKVTHLLFVNLVMDSLGAIMLGNEPARDRYMLEKPRRRDESLISTSMLSQISIMGGWLTIMSLIFLNLKYVDGVFDVDISNGPQERTAYFVLFIWSALFNGFNVRDEGYKIFSGLNKNKGFLIVFALIVVIQALIVNSGKVDFALTQWISNMFSCQHFGLKGWILVIAFAFTMIPVDLLRKFAVSLFNSNKSKETEISCF